MPKAVFSEAYELLLAELRAARKDSKLTQTKLAERLGTLQSQVSKYETRERRLDVVEFVEVCCAMETDPVPIIRKLERAVRSRQRKKR